MLLDDIRPSPDLAGYVRQYRIADFVFSAAETLPFKAYPPRPQECLLFYPKDTETVVYPDSLWSYSGKKCVVTGQHTVVRNLFVGRNFMVVMVVFQPGALYRLTGIPADELQNLSLDGEDVLGNEVGLINEQLGQANGYGQIIEVLENYLRRLVKQSRKGSHIIEPISQLMLENRDKSLEWFSREACLCYRQFDRKFKEWIGINPKLFMRIIRFDAAFRMKNQHPERDWLTIALFCGYYDYQHLVRDYKEFTGHTPNNFFALDQKAPERFFGDAET